MSHAKLREALGQYREEGELWSLNCRSHQVPDIQYTCDVGLRQTFPRNDVREAPAAVAVPVTSLRLCRPRAAEVRVEQVHRASALHGAVRGVASPCRVETGDS